MVSQDLDHASTVAPSAVEADTKVEMGIYDQERRAQVEKSLLRKLDMRCSIFVLIYIMSKSARSRLEENANCRLS